MGNPCGQVHMPNFPCCECDRVRSKQAIDDLEAEQVETLRVEAMPEKFDADVPEERGQRSDPQGSDPERHASLGASRGGDITDDAPSTKSDRLAVAKEAIVEGVRKEAQSAKKRQARHRANHLERVREREKLRKKLQRAKIRGSPSE